MKGLWLVLLVAGLSICQAGQMYKYKDVNGNLVFSDKPPEQEQSFETLNYAKAKKPSTKIKLFYAENEGGGNSDGYTLYAKNTYFSPVEIEVKLSATEVPIRKVIPARTSITVLHSDTKSKKLNYRWALGDPKSVADNYSYLAPFSEPKGHRITQGFNGKFSHTNEYNKYAVDIAMDVGTYLTAVRAGTVVWVKDDYHMSGTTRYFIDKANAIKVLHDDGTFASYAHILMDTAMVKEGDKIKQGDRLARSGSSGFSTGPHLHFVIVKNVGLKNIAIPFQFIDNQGAVFTPKRGMIMLGAVKR